MSHKHEDTATPDLFASDAPATPPAASPEHLAALPGAGKPGRVQGTREWRVKNTPYALIYDVCDGRIRILRVMHDSRQFPEQ